MTEWTAINQSHSCGIGWLSGAMHTGQNAARLQGIARKLRAAGYGNIPSGMRREDIIAPFGLVGDAPVLGYADTESGSKPRTPRATRATVAPVAPSSGLGDILGLLRENIGLLRAENARLHSIMSRHGIAVTA